MGEPTRRDDLVSVVIPTRNRADCVGVAVRSALAQQHVDVDVVVVDDASEETTAATIARIGDRRVRVLRNEAPLGESGARNRGIAAAYGRWIAFLDDDDLWSPDKLRHQLAVLSETGCGWAYAGDVTVDAGLRVLDGTPPPAPDEVLRRLRHYNSIPAGSSNVMVNARLLARVGPFDQSLRRTADWDMWLRLADTGPPACAPFPLVAVRVHPGNVSRDMAPMFEELQVIARRHGLVVDRARHYRWAAWTALQGRFRRRALLYYARAVAAGDVLSLARAAYATFGRPHPLRANTNDPWTQTAQEWIDTLCEEGAHETPDGHAGSHPVSVSPRES